MASIMDLILRVMGNSTQFREDMQQDKVVLEDFVNSVHDINLDINLEDADAKAKLDTFRAELDSLRDQTAKIELDDTTAAAELENFKLRLDALRNQSVDINLDDTDAKAKLDEFKLKWDDLRNQALEIRVDDVDAKMKLDEIVAKENELRDAVVNIDVNDADARAKVDDIKLKLDMIHDQRVSINVHDEEAIVKIDELDAKLDGVKRRIDEINAKDINPKNGIADGFASGQQSGMSFMRWIAVALPLAAPILADLVGGIGGIASAFTSASIGAAGFAVVATSDIKKVSAAAQKLQADQNNVNNAVAQLHAAKTYQEWLVASENLSSAQKTLANDTASIGPAMKTAVDALNQFKNFWSSYTSSFDPIVFKTLADGLKLLETILTDLRPTIEAAGKAIDGLIKSAQKNMNTPPIQAFFKWLGENAGPMITEFGKTAGYILEGFMNLMRDFQPLADSMGHGFENIAKRWADWTNNLGKSDRFKTFISYVETNGPLLLDVLSQFVTLITNITIGMAPIGSAMLKGLDALLKWVNGLTEAHPWMLKILGVGSSLAAAFPVLARVFGTLWAGISRLGPAFRFLGTILEWVGGAIVAVIGVIAEVVALPEELVAALIALVVGAVVAIIANWDKVKAYHKKMQQELNKVIQTIKADLAKLWADVKKMWRDLESFFPNLWKNIKNGVANGWKDITSTISTWASNAYKSFTSELDKLGPYFTNLWGQAKQWGANLVNMVADGIRSAIGNVKSAAHDVASEIKSFLGFGSPTEKGPGATSDRWIPNLMNMLVDGIHAGIPKVHAALNQVIIPPESAAMMGGSGSFALGGGIGSIASHVHVYGNVYSTDDIDAAAQQGAQKAITEFVGRVKVKGRTMGVSN